MWAVAQARRKGAAAKGRNIAQSRVGGRVTDLAEEMMAVATGKAGELDRD